MTRRQELPPTISRAAKRVAGRTEAAQTPLSLRAQGIEVDAPLEHYVRDRAGRKLGKFATLIERVTVRIADLNGPKGGVDTACRIKVVLVSAPSVVVEERSAEVREAFDRAIDACERAVRRDLGRRGHSRGRARGAEVIAAKPRRSAGGALQPVIPPPPDGSLIGRRVGRSAANLRAAAARPEKERRDVPVDTAQPGRSATDRRAGGGSTAARNTQLRAPRATATLEDSARQRPSRKSTRRSSNRTKQGTKLEQRQIQATHTPAAKAARAKATQPGPRGRR